MNFFLEDGGGIFHTDSSLTADVELGLDAKRFARLLQLYFSKLGTVAHSSPRRFEIVAKSETGNKLS